MNNNNIKIIPSFINGVDFFSKNTQFLDKYNPHNGQLISRISICNKDDVDFAIEVACEKFKVWSNINPVKRGEVLFNFTKKLNEYSDQLVEIISNETGKSKKDSLGEVKASIQVGQFFAGEGMRLYGKSLTSGIDNKYSHTVRQPIGVTGLIVPANTPLANIAWKVFPSLICGNSIVIKASEDAPEVAHFFAKISREAGLPDGLLNVIQGTGFEAGNAIVENCKIGLISFTGSTSVGKLIASKCGNRLAKVSLELGGKNPLVVCNDADIENAVHWVALSAFSNAGQRCASGSRIIIFEGIYDLFVEKFIKKVNSLKLGLTDDCDLGPVINYKQYDSILNKLNEAKKDGAKFLAGGNRSVDPSLNKGYYIQPTVLTNVSPENFISKEEIFGPVTILYKVKDIFEALEFAHNSDYRLTASIHTKDIDRAIWFSQNARFGVVNVNIGTFGSEPHMPFGGLGLSGNGTREPGVEALDVYTEIKNISFLVRNNLL
jgi:aldehyde dehydrogenase (NAD+)